MQNTLKRHLLGASVAVLAFCGAAQARAQDFFGTPNTITGLGSVSTNLGGQTFVNQGMVGAGRVAASARDFRGDTLGSFSGMALDLSTWRRVGSGYAGVLYTLPDRGYNTGATVNDYTNYAARINVFNLSLTPYSGGTLPQATSSQNQVTLAYDAAASFLLHDFNGAVTTGEDPQTNTTTQGGYTLPVSGAGREGAGLVSMDAEALLFRPDGSFYVGDEYSDGIYYFNKQGQMIGFIAPPAAMQPRNGANPLFTSFIPPAGDPNTSGRRANQGMEGVTLSPDGTRLFAVQQSASVQDSVAANQATRLNTSVLIYDVGTNPTPTAPSAHYVLQLPTFDRDGVGDVADRTAAQSEVLALNNTQFLMLTRDGNGVDNGDTRPIVFKSIYLVDVTGATNIAGTAFETTTNTPIAPNGVLSPTITPVQSVQFVNILNTEQLTRFGLNLDGNPATLSRQNNATTISEKWEALALAPVLEEAHPQDYFLFVGNDNDFKTRTGTMVGDAQYNSYDAGVENDSMLIVYRVTLPTYVNPAYYQAMVTQAPLTIGALGGGVDAVSQENSINIASHLDSVRRLREAGHDVVSERGQLSGWVGGGFSSFDTDGGISSDLADVTLGLGYALGPHTEVGVAVGWQGGDGDGAAFSYDYDALKISAYIGYASAGYFIDASYTYGDLSFDDIRRPAGFGQIAVGDTSGKSHNVRIEGGRLFDVGGARLGPVAGARWLSASLDGYAERGASGGNLTYSDIDFDNRTFFLGAEALLPGHAVTPSLRVVYNFADDDGLGDAAVRLTSVQSANAGASVQAPNLSEDFATAAFALTGGNGRFSWNAGYTADVGVDSGDVGHRVQAGFAVQF